MVTRRITDDSVVFDELVAVGPGTRNKSSASVPVAPAADEGVFWTKDDTPTVPMFTDGALKGHKLIAEADGTITASVTQTQGQQPLTKKLNRIAVCANANDVVTLPLAAGTALSTLPEVWVFNDGANDLQVFPASGDDLGAGVDASMVIPSGEGRGFKVWSATAWKVISSGVLGASAGGGTDVGYATIGSGGAYVDFDAAAASGATRYAFVSSVAEDSDVGLPADSVEIMVPSGIEFNLGDNEINHNAAELIDVHGGGVFKWAHTGSNYRAFATVNTAAKLKVDGVTLRNQSTRGAQARVCSCQEYYSNLAWEIPSYSQCGFSISGTDHEAHNVNFVCAGTGVQRLAAQNGGRYRIIDCRITGSISSTAGTFWFENNDIVIDGLANYTSQQLYLYLQAGMDKAQISRLDARSGTVRVLCSDGGDYIKISDSHFGGGLLTLSYGCNYAQLENITGILTLDLHATHQHVKADGLVVTNAVTFEGDYGKYDNCDFLAGGNVPSGNIHNGFEDSHFGAAAGGGANTLTINADNTRVSNCSSDIAIVNNTPLTSRVVGCTIH